MDKTNKILFGILMCLIALVVVTGLISDFFAKKATTTEALQQETPPPAVETPKENDYENLHHLCDLTIGVRATWSEASGLLVKRRETPYLWTAGYAVDSLRKEEVVTDPTTGMKTTVVTWAPATALVIKKDLQTKITADVIRYSGPYDPALLRLRETLPLSKSAVFAKEEVIPTVGLVVYHVASILPFHLYIAKGKITTIGKVYDERTYDVTSKIGISRSGGGGVFTEDGTCVGMVMHGTLDSDLILPSREIRRWAKEKNVLWALDPTVPIPSDEELKKIPVEG